MPSIFVGTKALAGSGATVDSLGAANLKASEGAVAAFKASSGEPAVAVLGADEADLAAAAVMFAGHLPHLSDAK